MTDAHRNDLNYGHFGEPVYDVESQEWHYSRELDNSFQLQSLGESRVLIPAQSSSIVRHADQTAIQRNSQVEKLVRAYPEFAPGSGLLSSLAEISEITQDTTAGYDPAISELLAFGRALHPHHHRDDPKTVPVVAIPGGPVRELVRVVLLIPEVVGWKGESSIKLKDEAIQLRVQGLWSSNGSGIQQLQFAESNGEPIEWLAVRHGGATSILRVILRDTEVPTLFRIPRPPDIEETVEFRIELEHIVTLTTQRSGGIPHADVCFNPQNPFEFAVTDQSSRWSIWRIQCVNGKTSVWTLAAGLSGQLKEQPFDGLKISARSEPRYDGWGVVKWISNGASIMVCNRRSIVYFELQDPPRYSSVPSLGLEKSKDWILGVTQAPMSPNYIFVATSSHIFWLHLTQERPEKKKKPHINAKILLTWTHFRNELDSSLSMQIIDLDFRVIVVLYSRLTGLKTVFTFDNGQSPLQFPSSVCDPYQLRITIPNHLASSKCLSLVLKAVRYESHNDRSEDNLDPPLPQDDRWYLKCVILNSDLSLHECFLVRAFVRPPCHPLEAPQSLRRQRPRKSPYKVRDEFIVPNGMLDSDIQDCWPIQAPDHNIITSADDPDDEHREFLLSKDQWTINFEWLADCISLSPSTAFDETLQIVSSRFSDRVEAASAGIVSLVELTDQEVSVGDVEENSVTLQRLLSEVENRQFTNGKSLADLPQEPTSISPLTSILLPSHLDAGPQGSLSQTYDALVSSWITSLAKSIPGRLRARTERIVRCVAAELQLASHGLRSQFRVYSPEGELRSVPNEARATLTLPVRDIRVTLDDSRRTRAKAIEQASTSSPIPGSRSFMSATNLPTPESTPSVHSVGSQSAQDEAEDSAIRRLRALASVASQPPLPPVMMGILNHWSVGQNPDDYDWETSKTMFERGDKQDEVAEGARAKKRQRRERFPKQQKVDAMVSSSQSIPFRPVASQVERPSDLQYSSQPTVLTLSQPEAGRYAGRKPVKKVKEKKPAGFR